MKGRAGFYKPPDAAGRHVFHPAEEGTADDRRPLLHKRDEGVTVELHRPDYFADVASLMRGGARSDGAGAYDDRRLMLFGAWLGGCSRGISQFCKFIAMAERLSASGKRHDNSRFAIGRFRVGS